jgi:unsaturated rhamnogalacturonyl hydrolase
MLGLLDVHKALPVDHPARPEIAKSLRRQIDGMLKLQRPDGRWWCVVDEPESGEEGSTAPFMATGFLRAMKQGIYSESELMGPALLALAASIDDVDERGQLTNVTAAVMASTRKSHYVHTPRGFSVPWGQGPLALAICEAAQLP